jgi:hypothetical protein
MFCFVSFVLLNFNRIKTESGEDGGWEEYWDYIFPDEEAVKQLQLQQQQQQQQQQQ